MNGLSCERSCEKAVNGCERDRFQNDLPSASLEELVIKRLEDAGRVLLAMPMRGYSTLLRTGHPEVVHDIQAYGWQAEQPRIPTPSAARITRMEEALDWIGLLAGDQIQLKRVLGRRLLVHPLNDRYLYSWRRIARDLHIDHKTAQNWHERGIGIVAHGLRIQVTSTNRS